jgi:hypothetical protein
MSQLNRVSTSKTESIQTTCSDMFVNDLANLYLDMFSQKNNCKIFLFFYFLAFLNVVLQKTGMQKENFSFDSTVPFLPLTTIHTLYLQNSTYSTFHKVLSDL